jgi:hypothetical protein
MQNIETIDALLPILNKSNNVIAMAVVPADFHDWNSMMKKLYSDFPAVLKYHLFQSNDITQIELRVGPDSPPDIANLRFPKRESKEARAHRLGSLLPNPLNPPGLKDIKQVELFTKFRKFLNPANWEKTCPYHGDAVMERIRKQRNEKQVAKKKQKEAIESGVRATPTDGN